MNTYQPVFRLLSLVIVAAALPLTILGQQTVQRELTPLPVEESLGQRNLLDQTPISLSRDGLMVAYTLRDSRRVQSQEVGSSGTYTPSGVLVGLLGSDVWITNTTTGQSQNLTNGAGTSWAPAWSPDGERLAFYSDRSGEQRVWLWERKSGAMTQLTDAPARSLLSDPIQWTADGTQILVRLLPEGMSITQANDLYVEPLQAQDKTAETTITVYRSLVPTSKEDKQRQLEARLKVFTKRALADLALINIRSGQVTRLTRGYHPIWFALSPDRRTLAFTEMKGLESDRETQSIFDIVAVDLGPNSKPRVLATNVRQQSGRTISWSPDSKRLAYVTGGPLAKGDCFVVSISGGDPVNLTGNPHPNFDNDFSGPIWDSAGTHIFLAVNRSLREADTLWRAAIAETKAAPLTQIKGRKIINVITTSGGGQTWSPDAGRSIVVMTRDDATKQEGLYKIELNAGTVEKLREGGFSFGRLPSFKVDVSANGDRVVYSLQSAGQPEDLWIADSRDLSTARRVTHSNPQLDRYQMGESQVIEWLSSDGQLLRGSLLLPAGYKVGTRYPMVVVQYPGAMYSNVANNYPQNSILNTQLLATRGYAVLLPDVLKRRGTIMSDIQKAVLPGVNKVVEMGIADSERIGVFGHSLGGYGVLSLIVQTTRFKAAVDSAGISNAITWYGQMGSNGSSIYVGQTEEFITGSTLWQNKASFIENSPVFFLDRVQTPLLILQGTHDEATDPTHSDQVFVFLRSLGKEVEYVKYSNAVHSVTVRTYSHQVDFLNRTISWFDRWLKPPATVTKP